MLINDEISCLPDLALADSPSPTMQDALSMHSSQAASPNPAATESPVRTGRGIEERKPLGRVRMSVEDAVQFAKGRQTSVEASRRFCSVRPPPRSA